jgi:hypothetical protein
MDVLAAAEAATRRGELAAAAELYERVVDTPPASGEPAAVASAVNGVAHFQAMVALLGSGEESGAREHLDALQERDPDAPFARLATQVWDQYGMTGDVRSACASARQQLASQAAPVIATLRSAGATLDADVLCRLP